MLARISSRVIPERCRRSESTNSSSKFTRRFRSAFSRSNTVKRSSWVPFHITRLVELVLPEAGFSSVCSSGSAGFVDSESSSLLIATVPVPAAVPHSDSPFGHEMAARRLVRYRRIGRTCESAGDHSRHSNNRYNHLDITTSGVFCWPPRRALRRPCRGRGEFTQLVAAAPLDHF
jgi:hypothetical protein